MQIDERVAEATGPPCVDCRHYWPPDKISLIEPNMRPKVAICRHIAHAERSFDPTVGVFHEREETPAANARSETGLCGPEGLLFEPIPIHKVAFQRFNHSGFALPAYITAAVIVASWLFG